MATPITTIDSPNISVIDNSFVVQVTGSQVGQADLEYLLSPKYSFTGSYVTASSVGGTVEFGYGVLQAPSPSPTSSLTYPTTTVVDFQFFLNGVRIDDDQIIGISEISATRTQASFNLGFPIRSGSIGIADVITAQGKFKV
jgi:hypothetical protein